MAKQVRLYFLRTQPRGLPGPGGRAWGLTGGVACSAIPDSGGVIDGRHDICHGALLRVIDTEGERRARAERDSSRLEPEASPGAAGAQGSQGAQGPPGVEPPTQSRRWARWRCRSSALRRRRSASRCRAGLRDHRQGGGPDVRVQEVLPRILADLKSCEGLRRSGSTPNTQVKSRRQIFGCSVTAGASRDLGRANLIAGGHAFHAFQTVSANVLHSFRGPPTRSP